MSQRALRSVNGALGWVTLWCIAITSALLWPLFTNGYLLTRGGVSTPHSYITPSALGIGDTLSCSVPQDTFIAIVSHFMDGGLAVKILLFLALIFAGLGAAEMPGGPGRLSNVVFMGMGEPLANYKRVLRAIRQITSPSPQGFGISQRHVTVSTVGVAPAIRRLADEDLAVTLAISLHCPDDDLRNTLVPANNRWPLADVIDAAQYYADRTGRRISIEYALIRDVNDQLWRADMLGQLLHHKLHQMAHVNLIPLNPTPGSEWDASPRARQDAFVEHVRAQGVTCTVRDTRGQDIAAACGQLAAEEK